MDVLISGLNSYIGKRAASNLDDENFHVYAIVRDAEMFRTMAAEPITAKLSSVDLLKGGEGLKEYKVDRLDLAIYFTQAPDLSDSFGFHLEMTRLKNFVELLKRNLCGRILLIARLIDKKYIQDVVDFLEKANMRYTIVLKNVALGKGSLADRYFRKLLAEKIVLYDRGIALVQFKPIFALDVLRWIRSVDWDSQFLNQIVELGGLKQMSVRDLFRVYRKVNHINNVGFPVPHFIHHVFFRKNDFLHREDMLELRRLLRHEYPVDNSSWDGNFSFSFTSLEDCILKDI